MHLWEAIQPAANHCDSTTGFKVAVKQKDLISALLELTAY